MDEKYVVFKREYIESHIEWEDRFEERALKDAVVIRTQDVFAASGLSAYANTIRAHTTLLRRLVYFDSFSGAEVMARRLEGIAAYFDAMALEATDRQARGDVKVPD